MMWAITSYYNPLRSKRRLSNYRIFRANLNAPLVAVELSFDGNFELIKKDADILIQVCGGAVLWQKERLLNIALKSVPQEADSLAWLDCDVILEQVDWVTQAEAQLRQNELVQLFSSLTDLRFDEALIRNDDHILSGYGIAYLAAIQDTDAFAVLQHKLTIRPVSRGLAWAANTAFLRHHGFYDALIVGSGDRSMAFAMYGRFKEVMDSLYMNSAQRRHYMMWAAPFHDAVRGRVGHIAGTIYHLWHGDIEHRGYDERYRRLSKFEFDPETDIKVGPNGAWQWARPRPELAEYLTNYFASRKED